LVVTYVAIFIDFLIELRDLAEWGLNMTKYDFKIWSLYQESNIYIQ
jgi:hypothetical protein